jgi:hypothetical protein
MEIVEFKNVTAGQPNLVSLLKILIMKRRRVKLGLVGLVVAEMLTYCRGIIQKMSANPHFPIADNPHNATLELAVDELESADIAAADGGTTLKAALRQKRADVFNVMRPYRDFVNEKGNGVEEILNTTGFPLAKLPGSKTDLGIPPNVRTKTLQKPGQVEVYCQRVVGATGYQIRYRLVNRIADDGNSLSGASAGSNAIPLLIDDGWVRSDPMGQQRQTVTGLESAMYHEFQMRAIGAGPPSAWSDSVKGLAA